MYGRPSAPYTREPSARAMNTGVPPTARNARTGLFTPPGMILVARSNSEEETTSAKDQLACTHALRQVVACTLGDSSQAAASEPRTSNAITRARMTDVRVEVTRADGPTATEPQ